jgi:predicted phage terminase large subunit-like protein
MTMETAIDLRPQPGPQADFLESPSDLAIFGGSAGGGKSFSLLLEMLYHYTNARFRGVIFRRTIPMVRLQGGLLDTSEEIYPLFGAQVNQSLLEWRFPSGATLKFGGLEHETDKYGWQGSQLSFLGFDELCQFTEGQFWYMISRLRSMSGIRGTVRGTCNPDPDSFVRKLIDWWIDADTGFAIKQRSGVLRWFMRADDELHWADTREELTKAFGPDAEPKSLTFIPASIFDNKILLAQDPSYLANLKSLQYLDRARLLDGNWNVRPSGGSFFRREWFNILEVAPREVVARVRFWDRAASEQRSGTDPDATCAVLMSKDAQGVFYVEHVLKMFATPRAVEKAMQSCAAQDGIGTTVCYHQDPASAGKWEAQATATALAGYDVRFQPASGDKQTRCKPASAQAEAGNIKLIRGNWNDDFLRELENFPTGRHDDQVDALSGAFERLAQPTGAFASAEGCYPHPQKGRLRDLMMFGEDDGACELERPARLRPEDF